MYDITHRAARKIVLVIFLALAAGFTVLWLFDSVRQSYQSGQLEPRLRRVDGSYVLVGHLNADDIQPWMTFDYVNVVFRLSSGFVQSSLGLRDSAYPNIRIDQYAKEHGLDQNQFLGQVRVFAATYGTE